jgi:hypothetical protein
MYLMIRAITPRNPVQRYYKQLLDNPKVPIIVSIGADPSGIHSDERFLEIMKATTTDNK